MAISNDYLNILVHPKHKTRLEYDTTSGLLTDPIHNDSFYIKENVPVLLTKGSTAGFDYKGHYQEDAMLYDYFHEEEEPVTREEINRLHQYILSEVPAPTRWILDVGCGGGWLAKAIAGNNTNVISMDISDINPVKATKNVPSPYHFGLVADVFDLPFEQSSIDCIVACEVIEHVVDPEKFVKALLHVLKPGGKLIITTPYNEFIRSSLCIHCNKQTPQNAHLHSFTETSIKRCIPESVKAYKIKIRNNKLLVKLHIQRALNFMPLYLWNHLDNIANRLVKKAYRLIIVVEK
jgi:2-polyprenyl-3-methyl-5-hydroxy-6-metoxy-1,4-benzoquinol methylase/uncharacterized protein YbaR (Trm112 family)